MRTFEILLISLGAMSLLLAYTSLNNYQTCKKYRVGTFYYHFQTDESIRHFRVVRNNTTQTEINEDNGNITKLKLHWIDDCTYEMRFLEGTEVLLKDLLDVKKKMILKTTIISSTDEYYIFKSTSNFSTHELIDTIWLRK